MKISKPPEWLLTFGDLLSLLVTFFILIYSMSSVDKNKFQQALGTADGAIKQIQSIDSELNYVYININNKLANEAVVVQNFADKVLVSFNADWMFYGSTSELTDRAKKIIFILCEVFFDLGNRDIQKRIKIDVISNMIHDNQKILEPDYQGSNMLKALAVVREFVKLGMDQKKLRSLSAYSQLTNIDSRLISGGVQSFDFLRMDFSIHLE